MFLDNFFLLTLCLCFAWFVPSLSGFLQHFQFQSLWITTTTIYFFLCSVVKSSSIRKHSIETLFKVVRIERTSNRNIIALCLTIGNRCVSYRMCDTLFYIKTCFLFLIPIRSIQPWITMVIISIIFRRWGIQSPFFHMESIQGKFTLFLIYFFSFSTQTADSEYIGRNVKISK